MNRAGCGKRDGGLLANPEAKTQRSSQLRGCCGAPNGMVDCVLKIDEDQRGIKWQKLRDISVHSLIVVIAGLLLPCREVAGRLGILEASRSPHHAKPGGLTWARRMIVHPLMRCNYILLPTKKKLTRRDRRVSASYFELASGRTASSESRILTALIASAEDALLSVAPCFAFHCDWLMNRFKSRRASKGV